MSVKLLLCYMCIIFTVAVGRDIREDLVLIVRKVKYEDDISERCKQESVSAGRGRRPAGAGQAVLLPHPDDCGLFYYCVGEELPPVCRDCPPGLHFNPAELVCDAPAHAGCDVPFPSDA